MSDQPSPEAGTATEGASAPGEDLPGQADGGAAPATPQSDAPASESAPAAPQSDAPAGGADGAPPPTAGEGPPASTEVDIGNIVEGTVQRITPYGAFVQLAGGKVGLIHISEIDRNYVKDVHEFLRESDVVKAKVLTIKEDGKIDLSIKAMQDPQPRLQRRRGSDPEFEQKLKRFMRQSEERQVDYKRSVEHKRK